MSGAPLEARDGWRVRLRHAFESSSGPVDCVGVGNPIRTDDGVGLKIVSELKSALGRRPSEGVTIHGVSLMPERLLSKLSSKNGTLLIFDAVEATKAPGEVVCGMLADTKYGYFATHNVPLRLVPGLAERSDSVYIVGIQPESLEVGEGLTPAVRESAKLVVRAVSEEVRARA